MKRIEITQTTLDKCINDAQRERLVILREGSPVALIVGVEGMDEEQLRLGSSDEFWKLIKERRTQDTISRAELEHKADAATSG